MIRTRKLLQMGRLAGLVPTLLILAAPATSSPGDVDSSDIPLNMAPGIIVTSPVSDNTQNHLRLAATFMVTGNLPDSTILATAVLPSGEHLVLREFPAEACSVRYSHTLPSPYPKALSENSCSPTSYPLTGFGLPTASLPVGAIVEVVVRPARLSGVPVKLFIIRTSATLRGIEQSTDRLKLEIPGTFAVSMPAFVYFGLWPVPVRPEAVAVRSDGITVDLNKDSYARRWATDLYSITIYQPGRTCDSVLGLFRSPLDQN